MRLLLSGGWSLKVGVVIWVEGNDVIFRVREGVRVERGDLLKVRDSRVTYVLRVYDFKPQILLTPIEVARISHERSLGVKAVVFDKAIRYYDTAMAKLVAEVSEEGIVRSPMSTPHLFAEVETLGEEELRILGLDSGDIELGYLRMGHRKTECKISLPGEKVFPHHILVASITGGGKTNFCKVLAWNILRQRKDKYSLLIIDAEGEYLDGGDPEHLGLVHSPYSERRLYYVTTKVSRPCKLRYEFYYKGVKIDRMIEACPLRIGLSELVPEDFVETGEFTTPQENLLWMLRRRFEEEWLVRLLEDRVDALFVSMGRSVPKNTISAVKRKVTYMINQEVFTRDNELNTLSHIVGAITKGKVVLIEMPSGTEAQERLLTVVLARRVFEFYRRCRRNHPELWVRLPTVLIVVEEAHRYLSKSILQRGGERRENIFTTISKRGRKYRVGLCTVTQMPGELEEAVIRQQLTKVLLPLPTRPDYMKVIWYSPYVEGFEEEIKNLDRGEAVIISPPSGLRFAVPIKVHSFEDLVRAELQEEIILPRRDVRHRKVAKRQLI